MYLCKIVFLTVILIVKVSCQHIIDSLTPTNLLPPSLFSHYKQQQLQFSHHKPDSNDDDGDNDNSPFVMTATKTTPRADSASNLSLLNQLQNQIIANDNDIESTDEQLTNIKNNKTKNFIQNFILYEWLTSRHDPDLIKPANNNNNNDKIEDNWRYYDDSEYDDSISSNNYEAMNQDKRSALRSARMSRRSQKKKETDGSFLPSVSVGAMSKLNDFFDQLNTNIKTLETTPNYHHISFDDIAYLESQAANNKKEYANDYYVKPSGTAAFLHAIRTYRPSQKIRGLVALQPEAYRGANFHDPNFLWQGLGK